MAGSVRATNYYVDSSSQFNALKDKSNNSFATLYPGDRVFLKGATNWGGLVQSLTGSMSDANAQTNPAIVYACDSNYIPTVGGVVITGVSQVNLKGSGVVFAGITFGSNSGMLPVGNATDYDDTGQTAWMISTAGGSRYNTISHIKFDHCGVTCTNTNDHYGPWVMMYGYHNTLQYSDFQGRDFNPNDKNVTDNGWNRTSIRDGTVVVLMQSADTAQWGHHTIRYNYFGPKLIGLNNDPNYYAPTDGAGASQANNFYEIVRLGVGGQATNTFACIVENNAFYHSFWSVYGGINDNLAESEMISAKSRGNVIRNNTVLNTHGEISLRQNDYSTVSGNFILGGASYDSGGNIVFNESVSSEMGGIRSFGFGNIIANNYLYNLIGNSLSSAFMLGEGTNTTGTLDSLRVGVPTDNNTFYETANYNWVVGNTFYNCVTINLDLQRQTYTNPVFATRFINNLIYYSSNSVNGVTGTGISGQNTDALTNHGGIAWGNWIYSPNSTQLGSAASMLGTASNTISTSSASNPLLTATYAGLYVPQTNSPVLGQGYALPPVNDTSDQAAYHDLAGYVAKFSAIDMRGLARPVSGQDIGDYQGSALGSGSRPLKRYEVGIVTNTYYPILLPSTNVAVSVGNLSQAYSGNAVAQATSTTTPLNIPVTYTYNGATNPPTNAGTYTVVAAVYDPIYGGATTTNLIIAQISPVITISANTQPYTGNAVPVTVTTAPAGIPVTVTYSGSGYSSTTNPPTNPGTYSLIAVASETANTFETTTNGILTITAAPAIVSNLNPLSLQGLLFTYQILTLNGATSFRASGLPPGLILDTNTGIITGTNSQIGTTNFSIIASNAVGSSTTTLAIQTTNSVYTYTNSATWVCPSNVTSVQIECWGAGGAGGSANKLSSTALGGGGAGGAYAKMYSYPVTPGTTYYLNVGSGGVPESASTITNNTSVPGGDSWFNSSNAPSINILAKGGAGGNAVTSGPGLGGTGSTNGSLGDLVYAGGSGAAGYSTTLGGGGGGSGGTSSAGNSATNGSTNGATAVTGGGNGGNPNTSGSSGVGQTPSIPPGGGGGGSRAGSSGSFYLGGNGAAGRVIITVKGLSAVVTPGGLTQTYDGTPKSISATTAPSNLPVSITYSNAGYPVSGNAPTNAGSYSVMTTVTNSSYTGSTNGTLTIAPATPLIAISGTTNAPYNGAAHSVSASIAPNFIPVSVTYNGSTTPPNAVGIYTVLASNAADALGSNWVASSATSTLNIYDPVAAWRTSYFGTTSSVGLSSDNATNGNGLNNLQSYTFGVEPNQSVSNTLLMISNTGSNTMTLSFLARAAGSTSGYSGLTRYYNLEATTNLNDSTSWSPVSGYSNIQGLNQVVALSTNTSGGTKWFYRLKAWLQ